MEYTNEFMNPEEFGLDISEDIGAKIQAVFAEKVEPNLKSYAVNVLIGNFPAEKLSDHISERFKLYGFHVKDVTYQDGHTGKYTVLFGISEDLPIAFGSASDKIYQLVTLLTLIYGTPENWKKPIWVKPIVQTYGENVKAYSLEIIGQERD